jgi:F-type H+-transporting ATPase subunit a
LLTIFFFILINNLLGLVPIFPGGANLTGNITTTMTLALFTFLITLISGSRDYWVHMVNTPGVPWWLKIPIPLMPIVEIMGVFIKPFVLMIRLFANMCAGHIIVLGFYSLIFIFGQKTLMAGYGVSVVSIAFTVFMGLLELLVAFIQAYVFTLLSAIYFGMALERHETHHHKEANINA